MNVYEVLESQVTCKGGVCACIALVLVHFLCILSNDFQLYLGMGEFTNVSSPLFDK